MQNPPRRLPPLDALLTFEAAARHLSFTRAAAERFVTQSAVSRQIKGLEDDLGVALFRRGHRSLQLSDAGRALFETCQASFERLRQGVDRVRARPSRKVLTITTTAGLASLWLIPRLARFTQEMPGVDVRIDASNGLRNLEAENIDVAVRYTADSDAHGERLFGEAAQPVCSPQLLASGPPLKTAQCLARHTLLHTGVDMQHIEWQPWLQAMGVPGLQPAASLSFTNYDGVIAAALLGQGVAMGRRPLVDDLLRDGRLVTPFSGTLATPRTYHVVLSDRARDDPAARALMQWLVREARSEAATRAASD